MIEGFLSWVARLDFFLDQALQEFFGLPRVSWEGLMIEVEVTLNHIAYDLELWVTRERHFSWEHDVEDNTQGPDVNFWVVVLKKYLRCDVVGLCKNLKEG